MKKTKKIFISRSSDHEGGGFGFTLRHFVVYPPTVSINDILQVKSPLQTMIFFLIHKTKNL
jgi:hypothetical protein